MIPSVRATYDSTVDGQQFNVTTRVGDETTTFQQPISDPFVSTTVTVGWWDAVKLLLRRGHVEVCVLVGGDRERVHDVLELDDQNLIAGRTRWAAFHSHVNDRLSSL